LIQEFAAENDMSKLDVTKYDRVAVGLTEVAAGAPPSLKRDLSTVAEATVRIADYLHRRAASINIKTSDVGIAGLAAGTACRKALDPRQRSWSFDQQRRSA
jgi:hypothetical protein